MFITGDPIIDTIILVAIAVIIFLLVRGQLRRRQAAAPGASSWTSVLAGDEEGELPEPHRLGWLGEHPAVLLGSPDQALRNTVKAALEYRQQGNMAETVRLLRACFIRYQNTPEEQAALLVLIGNCFFAQGRLEPAAGHFREAAELIQQGLASR